MQPNLQLNESPGKRESTFESKMKVKNSQSQSAL